MSLGDNGKTYQQIKAHRAPTMRPRVRVTATTAPAMTPASLELESGDGSLRDTVTGDEKSPPPTDVTACT